MRSVLCFVAAVCILFLGTVVYSQVSVVKTLKVIIFLCNLYLTFDVKTHLLHFCSDLPFYVWCIIP